MLRRWSGVEEGMVDVNKKGGFVCYLKALIFLIILETAKPQCRSIVNLVLCSSANFSLHLLYFGAAVG